MNRNVPDSPDWDFLDSILPVSRETKRLLEAYVSLTLRWQGKTNLIAPNTIPEIWTRHIADSLQSMAVISKNLPSLENWVDIGTGGGFPGMVVAIILANEYEDEPAKTVHLVESISKKCSFLRQANRECLGCAQIHNTRIENMIGIVDSPDVISARALASLPQLLDWIYPLAVKKTRLILYKGREYRSELEECRGLWQFNLVEHRSRIEPDSIILELSELERDNVQNRDAGSRKENSE